MNYRIVYGAYDEHILLNEANEDEIEVVKVHYRNINHGDYFHYHGLDIQMKDYKNIYKLKEEYRIWNMLRNVV